MADRGVLYVASKESRYVEEAMLSADSVKRRHPDLSITLFTTLPQHPLCGFPCFDRVEPIEGVRGFNSRWAEGKFDRLLALSQSPYERTLHLDADTRVVSEDLEPLFRTLDDHDVAMTETAVDDSYSRQHFGRRMFNGGLVLFRRNAKTAEWLAAWTALAERNFTQASTAPLPQPSVVDHVAAEPVRRKLLFMDQVALVEILSPEVNRFDLKLARLDYSWNHRGSQLPENNRFPVRISHVPALRRLTEADLLAAAFAWKREGRLSEAERLRDYVLGKYPGPRDPPGGAG
jgi:hypothetical protein